ncbi:MAG: PTS sugar transporter subunit IIA [bacterium]
MNLGIKDAVELLAVSDDTIYRWIRDQGLPCHRVNGQNRFNRVELLEWATAQGVRVSPTMFATPDTSGAMPSTFSAALASGGIHYGVPGANKHAALAAAIGKMPLPEEMDRDLLLDVILARESLGSTGIGDGIAIPHVRNPIVMRIVQPLVTLCFLDTPVEFNAVDGKPVHTLFTIVSPTVKAHLHLLARLAFALRQPEFASLITRQVAREEILACASDIEGKAADAGPRAEEGKARP